MSEFSSFRDMVDAGYAAFEGIHTDESLTQREKEELTRLDPTIEKVQRGIADLFAAEEAEARRMKQILQGEEENK